MPCQGHPGPSVKVKLCCIHYQICCICLDPCMHAPIWVQNHVSWTPWPGLGTRMCNWGDLGS